MLSEPLLLIAAFIFGLAFLLMIVLLVAAAFNPPPLRGSGDRGTPGGPSPRPYGHYRSDNQLDGDLNDITLGLWKA